MKITENTNSTKIVNDIYVTVPASLQFMTTYILHEQNDWFEDEIKFIRTFIKKGMTAIDIGANYGLYTLTIAKIIGDQGKIWAFEPTSTTSAYLRQSISDNNFNNVELIQAGLSDQIKKAKFFTDQNSELNSLSKESVSGNQHETVLLLTLDHCAKKYNWENIDFMKLDAEGEESNILKKGKKFLTSMSPLIMFELKHGDKFNLSLIDRFKDLSYEMYRLIPGLNILVPFDHTEPFDEYLLNLFCCKQDKATILASEGVIVNNWNKTESSHNTIVIEDYSSKLSFWKHLTEDSIVDGNESTEYIDILAAYILAHSESTSASDRVGYLMTALDSLNNMLENGEYRIERLATFARIAFDAGERYLGVSILSHLIERYGLNLDFEITEPFFPVSSRYDSIPPNNNIKEWLFSSILEQYTTKHTFSSYFTRHQALPQLAMLSNLGFMDEDMRRREAMIKSCF
ncbi:MAG: FkbM family methyltransferase [Desulfobulbaceae bacterium]|nr:FkbM family methyltransferase [Desulfobulbaceae bacterium]